MRHLVGSLGMAFVIASLFVVGLPNAPVARAATAQLVSGRALDSADRPIAGLVVQLCEHGADPSQVSPISSAVTDASGVFEISAPAPADINNYSLVLGWGSEFVPVTMPDVQVFPGTDLDVGDSHLRVIHAAGRVLNAKGQAAQGVMVSSWYLSEGTWEWFSGNETTRTDADGNYTVQLKPLVEYTVRFDFTDVRWVYLGGSSEEPIPGSEATRPGADADVEGLDVTLPAISKLKASIVTPYGETVIGANVVLFSAGHQPGADILFSLDEGPNGSFEGDVPSGDYDFVVDVTDSSPKVQRYTRQVSLSDDLDLGKLWLELADPSISGSVYDRYGSLLAGATATRLVSTDENGLFASEGTTLLTLADGGFGWSVNHPWNKIRIDLTGCPTEVTPPVEVNGGSVSDRGVRLVCGAPPVSALPTIAGTPTVGSSLTAVRAAIPPQFVSEGAEWLRDGAVVATGMTYRVTDADRNHELSVRQRFQHDPVEGFSGPVTFDPFSLESAGSGVPTAGTPTISGAVKIGETLTAVPGTWGPGSVSFAYQWLRDGVGIGGATGGTYTVNGNDFAKAISVRVTGSQDGYASVSRVSAATAKVPSSTMRTVVPTISGTLRVGEKLTAQTTGWVPGDATFTYKWFRSGKTIKGATAATHTLTASDLGKTIKVTATGRGTGYRSASATSKSTKKVGKGTIVPAVPGITGTVNVGQKVTAQPGTWQPTGIRFGYRWYRSGKSIYGASSSTYTLTASDLGKMLTVKVSGSKTAYTTAYKTSGATAAVAPGDLVPGTPTITGTGKVGKVLTAKPGSWKPSTVSFTYQWLRNGVAISRATSGTYKLVATDLGAKIAVTVTGKKAGYTTVAATSAETAAVAAA